MNRRDGLRPGAVASSNPASINRSRNRRAARIGPTVCELLGPMPMVKRSRTLIWGFMVTWRIAFGCPARQRASLTRYYKPTNMLAAGEFIPFRNLPKFGYPIHSAGTACSAHTAGPSKMALDTKKMLPNNLCTGIVIIGIEAAYDVPKVQRTSARTRR